MRGWVDGECVDRRNDIVHHTSATAYECYITTTALHTLTSAWSLAAISSFSCSI